MAENNKNLGEGTLHEGQSRFQGLGAGVSGLAEGARDTASGLMHSAAEQAGNAAESVAGGVRSLAGSLRQHAPSEGMLGSAAGSVANTLEEGSRYLDEGGFGRLLDDVSTAIRRNPIPCMLCTLTFGFVLGRLLASAHHSAAPTAPSTRSY